LNKNILLAFLLLGSTGCATLIKTAGVVSGKQELVAAGETMERAERDFTEEEKYYTGRTVAAQLLTEAPPSSRTALEQYLGRVGQTVAAASGKPDMVRGWHFILLKSAVPEAFSCPGGFVLVSEGLVNACRTEDELAAVLAHECAHVALDHPMAAISSANRKSSLLQLARFGIDEAAKKDEKMEKLKGSFENVVSEVAKAVSHGYDRRTEYEADQAAVGILSEAGYAPLSLATLLRRLPDGGAVHGSPRQRAAAVETLAAGYSGIQTEAERTRRFKAALQGL
jgi:predicted Zn-dependent protease